MTTIDFAGIDNYASIDKKILRVYIKGNYLLFYFDK